MTKKAIALMIMALFLASGCTRMTHHHRHHCYKHPHHHHHKMHKKMHTNKKASASKHASNWGVAGNVVASNDDEKNNR